MIKVTKLVRMTKDDKILALSFELTSVGAIAEEALGCRVWAGPWIPDSAFAGTGTITRPRLSMAYIDDAWHLGVPLSLLMWGRFKRCQ